MTDQEKDFILFLLNSEQGREDMLLSASGRSVEDLGIILEIALNMLDEKDQALEDARAIIEKLKNSAQDARLTRVKLEGKVEGLLAVYNSLRPGGA